MPRLNPNSREQLTRFAMLLQERGFKITEIARELGVYPETARYWFNYNMTNRDRGVAFQAIANYEGLGFKRVRAVIDFADEYLPHAKELLGYMSKLCFLSSYVRIFPSGYYLIFLTIPSQVERRYGKLLDDLQDLGIYRILEVDRLDWVRNTPMQARYFDFTKGRWDFDWSAVVSEKERIIPTVGQADGRIKYDQDDLQIIGKLEVDATRSLRDIFRELKMPYEQGYNHYNHITERGQILFYAIRWPATGIRSQEELTAWQQHHATVGLDVIVRNSTKPESQELLSRIGRLPFNWANGGTKDGGTFFSEFVIPMEYYSEAFQYLSEALLDSRGRAEFTFGDQAHSLAFTVASAADLYDKEAGAWTDDIEGIQAKFKDLVLMIKG